MPEALAVRALALAQYPVTHVAWFDAQGYAAWAGKQLPTEAQWARAAYGGEGDSDQYAWGDEFKPQGTQVRKVGGAPVDKVASSGCLDMSSNVSEWTRTPLVPTGNTPDFGDHMVVRGGSFARPRVLLSESKEYPFEHRADHLGFRCVRELPVDAARVLALLDGAPGGYGGN